MFFFLIGIFLSQTLICRAQDYSLETKFTQEQFDSSFAEFKGEAEKDQIDQRIFSDLFLMAMSDPKYWAEFSRYYSENNVPSTYKNYRGDTRSIACNLDFRQSFLEAAERKPYFDKVIHHLELLGMDLNQPCAIGTVYSTLEKGMYQSSSGRDIYTYEEVNSPPKKKPLTEYEMLIRAIDNKDGCRFYYQDEDKTISDWSGSPSFLGLRACGKCTYKDSIKRMQFLRAQQKKIMDELKKSTSKLIAAMKPVEDLNKQDPACQWYIMLYNFTGEDMVREKLKAPQSSKSTSQPEGHSDAR